MPYESIEREIRIEASPEVVYQVISTPEHLREWWPDEADLAPTPGAVGSVTFGDPADPAAHVVPLTVIEADPPRRFAFRWVHDDGVPAAADNSFLVTFDLIPADGGTLLRFSETGFQDQGWKPDLVEATHRDHSNGWDHFLPRLAAYAPRLVSRP